LRSCGGPLAENSVARDASPGSVEYPTISPDPLIPSA
jgi:hypothetical protein